MHKIYRNGQLYDTLDPATHAVTQFACSLAQQYVGDEFTVTDAAGECYYKVVKRPQRMWQVKNGPFFTGGELEISRKQTDEVNE